MMYVRRLRPLARDVVRVCFQLDQAALGACIIYLTV